MGGQSTSSPGYRTAKFATLTVRYSAMQQFSAQSVREMPLNPCGPVIALSSTVLVSRDGPHGDGRALFRLSAGLPQRPVGESAGSPAKAVDRAAPDRRRECRTGRQSYAPGSLTRDAEVPR